jgi:xanthine dehydrogenase YagT iron-sulfur-binding subunit
MGAGADTGGRRAPGGEQAARPRASRSAAPPNEITSPQTEVTLTVNGREERLAVDDRSTLLDMLRERLGLTGTKNWVLPASRRGATTASAGRARSCWTAAG